MQPVKLGGERVDMIYRDFLLREAYFQDVVLTAIAHIGRFFDHQVFPGNVEGLEIGQSLLHHVSKKPIHVRSQSGARNRLPCLRACDNFFICYLATIKLLIRPFVRPESCAVQCNAGKQSARARIGQDLRMHLEICVGRRGSAYRPCGHGSICTKSELARQKLINACFVHDKHDYVRFRAADLKTKTPAFHHYGGRCGPARGRRAT